MRDASSFPVSAKSLRRPGCIKEGYCTVGSRGYSLAVSPAGISDTYFTRSAALINNDTAPSAAARRKLEEEEEEDVQMYKSLLG